MTLARWALFGLALGGAVASVRWPKLLRPTCLVAASFVVFSAVTQ